MNCLLTDKVYPVVHPILIESRGDILAEEKGKAEEAAEKTGELVGKGLKKGFGVAKAFGKGAKGAVTEKKEEKK
jgi:hypothetical protein